MEYKLAKRSKVQSVSDGSEKVLVGVGAFNGGNRSLAWEVGPV